MTDYKNKNFTYNKFGCFTIAREGVNFIHQKGFGEDADEVLANSTSFGDPQPESIKLFRVKGDFYLSMTLFDRELDKGRGLIVGLNSTKTKNIEILQLLTGLKDKVSSIETFNDFSKTDSLTVPYRDLEPVTVNTKIPKIDGILFAILTQMPLIILGSHNEVLSYLHYFVSFLPTWCLQNFSFVTQSSNLTEDVTLIGVPPTNDNLQTIERNQSEVQTIFDVAKMKVLAPFTSNFCRKLAKKVKYAKKEEILADLKHLYELIKTYENISTIEEAVEKLNIHNDDAQFFLAVKSALKGKPIDPNSIKS
ncbi:MAG: hypothetical protein ACFFC7_26720, partial [Candidatus Hermodarchaeota archaeon]